MRVIIPSNFVKAGQNIKQDDKVTLLDEGTWGTMTSADGKEKKVLQFKMKIVTGETKQYTMNNTTMKIMMAEYTDDTSEWVNKPLKAHIAKQMAFGKMTSVLILTPPEWDTPEKPEPAEMPEGADIPVIEEPK